MATTWLGRASWWTGRLESRSKAGKQYLLGGTIAETTGQTKQISSKSTKKKNWFNLMAPKVFGGKQVGQAVASKITELEGRQLEVPLSDLTGNFKHFATKVSLKVSGKTEGGLTTEYVGQELMRDQISRNVRRWSSRIDGIQDIKLKDGKEMRVKSLVITARRVNTAIKKELRAETFKELQESFSQRTLDEVVEDINNNKIQGMLEGKLKKIYPVKSVNIRKTEVY